MPAAPALGLKQEDVVGVEVGADRAARRCEGGHQVVDTPVGDEPEGGQCLAKIRQNLVEVGDHQRPAVGAEPIEGVGIERAAPELPWARATRFNDQPTGHLGLAGEPTEFVSRQGILETGKGIAKQQGALLPVVAHKALGINAVGPIQGR